MLTSFEILFITVKSESIGTMLRPEVVCPFDSSSLGSPVSNAVALLRSDVGEDIVFLTSDFYYSSQFFVWNSIF